MQPIVRQCFALYSPSFLYAENTFASQSVHGHVRAGIRDELPPASKHFSLVSPAIRSQLSAQVGGEPQHQDPRRG